jgi:hypothetical protein
MAIRGIVGAGGKLYLRTESGLHTLKNNGKEPRDWDKAQFSSTPGESPFMEFFFGEIYDLVSTSTVDGKDREELRAYKDQQIPVLNRKKHYDDFVRALWHGYKDLMPKVLRLLGYDIGFLFQRDGNFKSGLKAFVTENRNYLLLDVAEFLPRQRDGWQRELKMLRNEYLEHRDADVAAQVQKFYEPAWAEKVFVHAWRTAAELIVFLLETRFPPQMSITHRTAERQFPNHPRLYEVYLCDPAQVQRRSFTKNVK